MAGALPQPAARALPPVAAVALGQVDQLHRRLAKRRPQHGRRLGQLLARRLGCALVVGDVERGTIMGNGFM